MDGAVRFVVEDFYSIPTRGVVATGRVEQGTISVGQEIGFLAPDGKWTIALVVAIEVNKKLMEEAQSGDRAGVLLQGIKKDQLTKGSILTEVPARTVQVSAPSPAPSVTRTSTPSLPSYGDPIQPTSNGQRTFFLIALGILVILLLFYFRVE